MSFTVTLTASGARPTIGVAFDTADGPGPTGATAPSDYTRVSRGSLVFPAGTGNATATITVSTNGDTDVEPDETFFVNLSRADGATIVDGQGVGTITNDDGAALPTLSIDDVSVVEGNDRSEDVEAVFTVSVSGVRSGFITFGYATADGTASGDYAATSFAGERIGASDSAVTIRISIAEDTTVEPDETFSVILRDPVGATIAKGVGVCTIVNDDSCSFSINPSSQTFLSSGGAGSISVRAQAGCNWTAVSNAGFITITSGASGSGDGTVDYSVAANTGQSRTGTMTIAGLTFTVAQSKVGCSFSISPTSQTFPTAGGVGTVMVSASRDCPWTASSNVPWITINPGTVGIDGGTVRYEVAPSTASDRTGTMSIAGQTFTVRQFATGRCRTRIDPLRRTFGATGGLGQVRVLQEDPVVQTSTACNCVSVRTNVDWIAIGRRPSGCDSSMSYEVAPNLSSAPRTGTIEFGSVGAVTEDGSRPEFIVEQTFVVSQRGTGNLRPCVESISPVSRVIGGQALGEGYQVNVTAPADCTWEPISSKPWVRILKVKSDLTSEEGSGKGNGSFNYDMFGSAFGDFRSVFTEVGIISVGGKEHTVYVEDWVTHCLINLFCKYLPNSCPDGTLSEAREFRDQVLARTPRGQRYTQLYYKFSTEAVGIAMLNPSLILRSRDVFERYRPILNSMIKGEQVTLTQSDIEEIDSFLNSFAQKGSPELRESLKRLSDDLRDPQVHSEFNIIITDGPKRELPTQGETVKQMGMMTGPVGLALLCVYAVRARRRRDSRRDLRRETSEVSYHRFRRLTDSPRRRGDRRDSAESSALSRRYRRLRGEA